MKASYTILAKYYDLIFQSKDYLGESNFIKRIINKKRLRAKSILDVGCGTGTHLNFLKDEYKVLHGVDLNPEIIKEAKKKSPKISYSVGGMADFSLEEKFDVIICLYSVFNYNLTLTDAKKTLSNFKKHLKSKGLIILALYTPNNTEKQISLHIGKKAGIEVAKVNQFSTDVETKLQTSDFLVFVKDKNGVNFYTEPGHKCRIYEINEFNKLLKGTGFKNVEVFDNFTDKPISEKTKYPVFVASLGD